MSGETQGHYSRNTRAKYGANTAIYALIALAIVVVVNLIANRFVKQIDLTSSQIYSLAPQTVKVLAETDRDVEMLYFDRKENFAGAKDLLEQYPIVSHRVKLTYVDPDREPGKAKEFNIKTYATVVVSSGDRQETSRGLLEEDITNTIIRVLKGGPKTIYFLTGHGERDVESTDRIGYSEAKSSLQDSNYEVKPLNLLQEKPQIPEDCSVLVVAGPQKDLLDSEIETIGQYLLKGGRVMFLIHQSTPEKLKGLMADFGADVSSNLVFDTSGAGRQYGTDEVMPLVEGYEDHPITKDLRNTATLYPMANAIQISGMSIPGAKLSLIAKTTQNSWATTDVKSTSLQFRKGIDLEGPLALAAAGIYRDPATNPPAPQDPHNEGNPPEETKSVGPEGRIVVVGSTDIIANAVLGFIGNRDFFLNSMSWLASDEDLISIRPISLEDRRVQLSTGQMSILFYLTMVVVPLGIVLTGFGIWWKRRG